MVRAIVGRNLENTRVSEARRGVTHLTYMKCQKRQSWGRSSLVAVKRIGCLGLARGH